MHPVRPLEGLPTSPPRAGVAAEALGDAAAPAPEVAPRLLTVLAGAAVALFAVVEGRAVFLRYLVNDDYQMLYTGWLRSRALVPGRDFGAQSFHVLPDLLALGFRALGEGLAVAWAARGVVLVAALAAAWLAAVVARRVVSPTAAPFAAVYALFTWGVLVRGGDLRPDVITAALSLGLLALVARPLGVRPAFWAGLVLAAAAAVRFKALVVAPALAGAVVAAAWRAPRRGRALGALALSAAAGAGAVAAAFAVYLAATGQGGAFLEGSATVARIAAGGAAAGANPRAATLDLALRHDAWFAAFAAAGACAVAAGLSRREPERAVAAGSALAAAALLVLANPALYAYSLAPLGLLLAPIAAATPVSILRHAAQRGASRSVQAALAAGLLLLPVALHAFLLAELALRRTNDRQLALHAWLARTPADTVVWALEGVGLFRPSLRDWRLAMISLPLYRSGEIDLGAQLDAERPDVVVTSYRVPGWLSPADARRVDDRSVAVAPELRALGAVARPREPAALVVRRARRFRVAGACDVDGVARRDEAIELAAGQHAVAGACAVVLDVPPLPPELSRPGLPFLLSPDAEIYRSP